MGRSTGRAFTEVWLCLFFTHTYICTHLLDRVGGVNDLAEGVPELVDERGVPLRLVRLARLFFGGVVVSVGYIWWSLG